MPIAGHGIDLVETARIKHLCDQHGDHFLSRVFTHDELAYCAANSRRYYEHLAGRFAAKEAVLKALGTGWSRGIAWTEIEVVRAPDGRPTLKLTGVAAQIAAERNLTHWHISLSHIQGHAVATAIAETLPLP